MLECSNKDLFLITRKEEKLPFPDDEASGGTLEASANNVEKYTAQITLSAANPAVKTEGEISSASDMAT